jgi:uncharacterized OB-fold protein
MFPQRKICPKCRSGQVIPKQFKGNGKVITYTIIRVSPHGFEKETPYAVGIVELDEGPRLTAQIVDCVHSEIDIGSKVETCFRKISEDGSAGAIYYGYKFRLVK